MEEEISNGLIKVKDKDGVFHSVVSGFPIRQAESYKEDRVRVDGFDCAIMGGLYVEVEEHQW